MASNKRTMTFNAAALLADKGILKRLSKDLALCVARYEGARPAVHKMLSIRGRMVAVHDLFYLHAGEDAPPLQIRDVMAMGEWNTVALRARMEAEWSVVRRATKNTAALGEPCKMPWDNMGKAMEGCLVLLGSVPGAREANAVLHQHITTSAAAYAAAGRFSTTVNHTTPIRCAQLAKQHSREALEGVAALSTIARELRTPESVRQALAAHVLFPAWSEAVGVCRPSHDLHAMTIVVGQMADWGTPRWDALVEAKRPALEAENRRYLAIYSDGRTEVHFLGHKTCRNNTVRVKWELPSSVGQLVLSLSPTDLASLDGKPLLEASSVAMMTLAIEVLPILVGKASTGLQCAQAIRRLWINGVGLPRCPTDVERAELAKRCMHQIGTQGAVYEHGLGCLTPRVDPSVAAAQDAADDWDGHDEELDGPRPVAN